jgi:hypothetical protein
MTLRLWDPDRRLTGTIVALAMLLIAAACTSTTRGSGAGTGDLITSESIESLGLAANDAYFVVDRIRPAWLRQRGPSSIQNPNSGFAVVYLDGTRYGEIGELRGIRADQVATIQYLNSSDATTRFGLGHVGGAILVMTRR